MTIQELFEKESINEDFVEKKFEGSYWESCNDFLQKNWTRDINTLSEKQGSWLTKILDDCVEKRIQR